MIFRANIPISACISRHQASIIRHTPLNIIDIRRYRRLYLAKQIYAFLNSINCFDKHLCLYLGRRSTGPLFLASLSPLSLIARMVSSPNPNHIVPSKPIAGVPSAEAQVALAFKQFPARFRARLLAQPDPSVRHKYLAAALTTTLVCHHCARSLDPMMALL